MGGIFALVHCQKILQLLGITPHLHLMLLGHQPLSNKSHVQAVFSVSFRACSKTSGCLRDSNKSKPTYATILMQYCWTPVLAILIK